MTQKRIHRKIERTPEEVARLKGVRETFQTRRPALEDLIESDDYSEAMSQETYLITKQIAHLLKQAREQNGMSLADVASITGIGRSAISRLETGVYPNTTVSTLTRLASAYKMRLVLGLTKEEAKI